MKLAGRAARDAEKDEDGEEEAQLRDAETLLEDDLIGEVVDLRDERALLDVHLAPVPLELAHRARVHLGLRAGDALQPTDVFA